MTKEEAEEAKLNTMLQEVSFTVKSTGWGYMKEKFIDLINEVGDIGMYKEEDPAKLMLDIKASKKAIGLLRDWINIVEGMGQQVDAEKEEKTKKIDEYIRQFD